MVDIDLRQIVSPNIKF